MESLGKSALMGDTATGTGGEGPGFSGSWILLLSHGPAVGALLTCTQNSLRFIRAPAILSRSHGGPSGSLVLDLLSGSVFQTLLAHLHWPNTLTTLAGPSPTLPAPTQPHPHQGSWLELQGHVLQEGQQVGWTPLHLLQALELAVLLLCALRVRIGVRLWGEEGPWA